MNYIKRFLLFPVLAPFLILIAISFLNHKEPIKLKILLWETPSLTLGSWIALTSTASAIITFTAGYTSLTPINTGFLIVEQAIKKIEIIIKTKTRPIFKIIFLLTIHIIMFI